LIILIIQSKMYLTSSSARVAELADALDLGSSGEIRRGSNPLSRTTLIHMPKNKLFTGGPAVQSLALEGSPQNRYLKLRETVG
jgi:hypothetical protein